MDMQKYLSLFVSEANEHLQAAADEASRLGAQPIPPELLNSLFRHFHSIKGMAASMGFAPIASLSHAVEDLFDTLRKNGAPEGEPADEAVLEAVDTLCAMVAAVSRPDGAAPALSTPSDLIEKVRSLAKRAAHGGQTTSAPRAAPPLPAEGHLFRCTIVVDPHAELPGPRAALALERLESLGTIIGCRPPRETLKRADFAGEISALLATDRSESEVLASVANMHDQQRFEMKEELPQTPRPAPRGQTVEPGPAGDAVSEPEAQGKATLRIETASLDKFLDSISEMIVRRGSLTESLKTGDLAGALRELDRLSESVDDLREQVMVIRLLPLEHITPRLGRTVRELSRKTGKRVSLKITGSQVALDRSVLEALLDPFNHILRNAVDHGIESPEERERLGKPPAGNIGVEATRRGEQVLVVVEDDGRGMDVEAIRRTALAGGFATRQDLAAMDDDRILLLTTVPGFSTSTHVTDLSGRGVGMDVVRTRIEALGGHMRISSQPGAGTRIEMTLPLTVAVVDAFLVDCRAGVFAVPAAAVAGVQLAEPRRLRFTSSGWYLAPSQEAGNRTAGETTGFLPLIRLEEALGRPGRSDGRTAAGPSELALQPVLTYLVNGNRGALAVDRIRERRQVVVKPLKAPLEHLRRYSGAALLEDGQVALILDLASLRPS